MDELFFLCSECETLFQKAHVFCSDCGQNLCEGCNMKLHKRSKRIQHHRNEIISPRQLCNQTSRQMAIVFGDFFEMFKDNQVQFIL